MQKWLNVNQRQVSNQIRHNKLPHALLLSGVKNSGYEELAQWLVNILLCQQHRIEQYSQQSAVSDTTLLQPCGHCKTCKLYASGNYPDHITLSTDKATIGVDEVRNLSHFFEKTAHIGEAKTALITQADRMTIPAANALLKTLEEPTSNSFIILTTDCADTLLPTIISRCQQIEIRPPVGEKLIATFVTGDSEQQNQLSGEQLSKKKPEIFANLSHYSELSDPNVADAFELFREHIKNYLYYQQNRTEVLNVIAENKEAIRWFERIIVDLMREQWHWQSFEQSDGQTKLSQGYQLSKEQLWQIYCLIQNMNMKLKTLVQVNRLFLSEKLLVDINKILMKEK